MNKVQLNPQTIIGAVPTVLVGSIINGKPNFLAVAWCGVVNSTPPMVSISIRPSRYTLKGIRESMEFSVNVPPAKLVKETDYCGIISGAKIDKASVCKFKIFYGKSEHAPFIKQCPINLSCKVEQILELGCHQLIIGKIEETLISDNCLTEGKPDIKKIKPIVYAPTLSQDYFTLGKSLGKAFVIGQELTEK